MKKYAVAKLISGEMVIGYIEDQDTDYLRECFSIIVVDKGGVFDFDIVPYLYPFEQDGSLISTLNILAATDAPEEIKSVYIQKTSGIIIPKGNIL